MKTYRVSVYIEAPDKDSAFKRAEAIFGDFKNNTVEDDGLKDLIKQILSDRIANKDVSNQESIIAILILATQLLIPISDDDLKILEDYKSKYLKEEFNADVERDKLTRKLRIEILRRDKYTCQLCGAKAPNVELTVDHRIPIKEGGRTEKDNLQVLCYNCNLGKFGDVL